MSEDKMSKEEWQRQRGGGLCGGGWASERSRTALLIDSLSKEEKREGNRHRSEERQLLVHDSGYSGSL